jgi:hypothetical protein
MERIEREGRVFRVMLRSGVSNTELLYVLDVANSLKP